MGRFRWRRRGWTLSRNGFDPGNAKTAPRGRAVSSIESIESCGAGGKLSGWSRAAFERPLAYVELTEPNTRTVATAIEHGLHQFRWSPLERKRCASFQADVLLVDQIMVKIADDGEVPRLVANAMAAVLNVMYV